MYKQIFSLQAQTLKALAHPRRLEIVNLIRDQEKCCVGTIHQMLDLPQANVSQHLQILREQGIVNTKRQGKKIFYSLSSPKIVKACDLMKSYLIEKFQHTALADEFTLKMSQLTPVSTDPVCGMRVSPRTAGAAHKHRGQVYYFCASGCAKKFKQQPEKYL